MSDLNFKVRIIVDCYVPATNSIIKFNHKNSFKKKCFSLLHVKFYILSNPEWFSKIDDLILKKPHNKHELDIMLIYAKITRFY